MRKAIIILVILLVALVVRDCRQMTQRRAVENREAAVRADLVQRIDALQVRRLQRRTQAVELVEARHGLNYSPAALETSEDRWLTAARQRLVAGPVVNLETAVWQVEYMEELDRSIIQAP